MAPRNNTFEIVARSALARTGRFHSNHGVVNTPTLLPVVNPNMAGDSSNLTPKEIQDEFPVDAIITNSYIIWKGRELKERALSEGVHRLTGFDGCIMTDSGTFQMYMYGDVEVGPEEIVSFQRDIGSDIGTILDLFTTPDHGEQKAREDLERTYQRGLRAVEHKGRMALSGTIQGGVFPRLRREAARRMSSLDMDVHPIGGVVPLMESYRYRTLVQLILAAKKELIPSRPVHLFGAGHPMMIPLAVALGCDLFDSASYAKFAQEGRMMFEDSSRYLKDLNELPCSCPVCSSTSVSELRSMPLDQRTKMLARHNLHMIFKVIKQTRQAIHEGTIWELAERSLVAHPHLAGAMDVMYSQDSLLESREPTAGRRFFYTGRASMSRPIIRRFKDRFRKRYRPGTTGFLVGFMGELERRKPYHVAYHDSIRQLRNVSDCDIIFLGAFGPVPVELDGVYPIAQSIVPELDRMDPTSIEGLKNEFEAFSHRHGYSLAIIHDEHTVETLGQLGSVPGERDPDMDRVRAVCDHQFTSAATDALFPHWKDPEWVKEHVKIRKSRRTGMIRNVLVDSEHVLSMRAHDGLFTLKPAGALRILRGTAPPFMRLRVNEDSVPFNRQGRSVFAPFVESCDPDLRPMDECIIVDPDGNYVNIGRLRLAPDEIAVFKTGMAADARGSGEEDTT